ncbi:hypothetical protein [Companilactobacillus sp. DQM5]|uniref:hypothetical protein n=1 Tax=Companilactobacillus sp. DQM5 TaxID=3463359 RepID=UPI004059D878
MNSNYDPDLVTAFFNEYQDRGTMKWQGFYLSDHTAAVKNEEKQISNDIKRIHTIEMSESEIQEFINEAIKKQQKVRVELRELTNDLIVQEPIIGKIEGYYLNKLLVSNRYIDIEDIYSIKKESTII